MKIRALNFDYYAEALSRSKEQRELDGIGRIVLMISRQEREPDGSAFPSRTATAVSSDSGSVAVDQQIGPSQQNMVAIEEESNPVASNSHIVTALAHNSVPRGYDSFNRSRSCFEPVALLLNEPWSESSRLFQTIKNQGIVDQLITSLPPPTISSIMNESWRAQRNQAFSFWSNEKDPETTANIPLQHLSVSEEAARIEPNADYVTEHDHAECTERTQTTAIVPYVSGGATESKPEPTIAMWMFAVSIASAICELCVKEGTSSTKRSLGGILAARSKRAKQAGDQNDFMEGAMRHKNQGSTVRFSDHIIRNNDESPVELRNEISQLVQTPRNQEAKRLRKLERERKRERKRQRRESKIAASASTSLAVEDRTSQEGLNSSRSKGTSFVHIYDAPCTDNEHQQDRKEMNGSSVPKKAKGDLADRCLPNNEPTTRRETLKPEPIACKELPLLRKCSDQLIQNNMPCLYEEPRQDRTSQQGDIHNATPRNNEETKQDHHNNWLRGDEEAKQNRARKLSESNMALDEARQNMKIARQAIAAKRAQSNVVPGMLQPYSLHAHGSKPLFVDTTRSDYHVTTMISQNAASSINTATHPIAQGKLARSNGSIDENEIKSNKNLRVFDGAKTLPTEISNDNELPNKDTAMGSIVQPIGLLCSEHFLETWGDVATELGCGSWVSGNESDGSLSMDMQMTRKIELIDTPLVDECGVDIELINRSAVIIHAASALADVSTTRQIVLSLASLVAIGRYHKLYIFLSCDVPVSSLISLRIVQMQNAAIQHNGISSTKVHFNTTDQASLASTLAERLIWRLSDSDVENHNDIVKVVRSEYLLAQQAHFLLSIVPVLSASGAIACFQLATRLSQGRPVCQQLFGSHSMRQQVMLAATSKPSKAPEIHPNAMIQLQKALCARNSVSSP